METMIYAFDGSHGSFTWNVVGDRRLKARVILFDNPKGGGYVVWDECGRIIETSPNMKRRARKAVLRDGRVEFVLSFGGFEEIGANEVGGSLLIQVFRHSYLGKLWIGSLQPFIVGGA